jgi:rare lipoprotein A (peptidoglycan hydrolase)
MGYPAGGMYAAAGSELRVGDWRGRHVVVRHGGRSVRVQLIDWCACGGRRIIDLYGAAFKRLAPLGLGEIAVEVEWGGSSDPGPTLPPTDTAP